MIPHLREETTIVQGIEDKKDTSGSGLEFRRVLAMIIGKKTRKVIYKEMDNYRKWASAGDDYKNTTYNKAMDFFIQGQEKKEEPKKKIDTDPEKTKKELREHYFNIIKTLKKYCDIKEEYYQLIALWIIGTYFHNNFETFPYLFINAMKGSGKTRLLKLISSLALKGEILTSMSEAVLFRTKGSLCIDEFESVGRKGYENLMELLNTSYKRGSKVKRMRKAKTVDGEQQVVETFEVYRPIVLANIFGMDSVLGDRCISIILEKSSNKMITRLIEDFQNNIDILDISKGLCSLCNVVTLQNIHTEWNNYLISGSFNYISTDSYNYTNIHTLFKKIEESGIDGRNLEISFSLFIISSMIGDDVLDKAIETIKLIVIDRKTEEFTESRDVSFIDFVSQEINSEQFISVTIVTQKFKEFLNSSEEWLNSKWVGRALRRLNLILKKRRITRGIEVVLDVPKAQDKIRMFK